MAQKPSSEQLHQLLVFLRSCEKAANPPPALRQALRHPRYPAPPELGPHPEMLADLIPWKPAPFEATERLTGNRVERVALLYSWLRRFPVFTWLKKQPALTNGFESFTRAAGIKYPDTETFRRALDQLNALATIERRPRTDGFTNDRKYVEFLAEVAISIFDDAPPALIFEVAAFKVKNPDKVSITKQVSAFKKRLLAEKV